MQLPHFRHERKKHTEIMRSTASFRLRSHPPNDDSLFLICAHYTTQEKTSIGSTNE